MRRTRTARAAGLIAVAAALIAPTSASAGVLVNYAGPAKLKIGKKLQISIVCAQNCSVDSTTTVKGPRFKDSFDVSGPLTANVVGGPFFQPNGPLLKQMKSEPGKFRIVSSITATNAVTGFVESINKTFRLKR